MTQIVRVQAHAKFNAFLRVLAQETSGYHTIETLFVLLELADDISVERASTRGIDLEVEGAETGPAEQNLAVRAAKLVLDATGNPFGVRIRLTKRIPVQAGLGGGSSDAAATLYAVNALAGNPVPRHEILQFASRLGSDVPFFAAGAPMALAWGRGERLFRLPPLGPAPVLLAIPPTGVATPNAYAALDASRPNRVERGSVVLDPSAFASWGGIGRLGGNDFETVLFGSRPELKALFEKVARTAPVLARLSGSGSSIVAVYRTVQDREAAKDSIGSKNQTLMLTSTRGMPPSAPS
jgi:4-diphosphocytidyl-2-C-methyl-D-erythritol kinase